MKEVMESRSLSASEFAEIVGIKKANVSHVLSGRNKPSLEFVIKFCEAFEEVDANSLLFPMNNVKNQDVGELFTNDSIDEIVQERQNPKMEISNGQKQIERIVVFYQDKTFTEYRND